MNLSEEQGAVVEMSRKYAESELAPVTARLDLGERTEADRELFLKSLQGLTEPGFMGMNVKADYGGCEAGTIAFSLAITEIARACASTAVTMSVTNMVGEVIRRVFLEKWPGSRATIHCRVRGGLTGRPLCYIFPGPALRSPVMKPLQKSRT